MLENQDIRNTAKEKGVNLWEIAEYLKISDPTMTRRLRRELPQSKKNHILEIIDTIAQQKAEKEAEYNTAAQITSA